MSQFPQQEKADSGLNNAAQKAKPGDSKECHHWSTLSLSPVIWSRACKELVFVDVVIEALHTAIRETEKKKEGRGKKAWRAAGEVSDRAACFYLSCVCQPMRKHCNSPVALSRHRGSADASF